MKTNVIISSCFKDLDPFESMQLHGGGFAYDVGRLIRFIGPGSQASSFPMALFDAIYNEAANQAANS